MGDWNAIGWGVLSQWGVRLAQALLVFVFGWLALGGLSRLLKRFMIRRDVDPVIGHFSRVVLRVVGWTLVTIVALGQLGVETTSLITVLGAAGLAVGLALKDSLQNLASGFLLIALRPFRAGDLIEVMGSLGTVQSIELFSTKLTTPDNRQVYLPNGQVFGGSIINYSQNGTRRVDLTVGVAYGDDLRQALQVVRDAVAKVPLALTEPPPFVGAIEFGASSVDLTVQVWTRVGDYWAARSQVIEQVKGDLEAAGITVPFPQLDVHMQSAAELKSAAE